MLHEPFPPSNSAALTLVVRRKIPASPEFAFQAWTQPARLKEWWGPAGVKCVDAEIELRVGGVYRIANQFPDGKIVWITGEYQQIEFPRKLVYTWRVEPSSGTPERVTVEFEPHGDQTQITVTHERIPNVSVRDRHEAGWNGCLDGIAAYAT
jgi:uncharacterized protein YndB with AHSA1/START domain